MHPFPFQLSVVLATIVLTAPAPRAQPPAGWLAVASLRDPTTPTRPGPGGVWFVHPRDTTLPVMALTGALFPPALTGLSLTSASGANCITWRASDGALVVGEMGRASVGVGLHVLHLGNPVAPTVVKAFSHPVGTVVSPYGGGVVAAATLPDSSVLFATFGLDASGPLGGAPLGRLDAATQTIVPYPVQFPTSFVPGLNALTVDAAGKHAYVANNLTTSTMDIYRIPLGQTNPSATWVAQLGTLVSAMALDPTGTLLTAVGFGGMNNVWIVNLQQLTVTSCPGLPRHNGLALEEHTGQFVALGSNAATVTYSAFLLSAACGTPVPLAGVPSGGWGVPAGIVAIGALRPYGAPTVHANRYDWVNRPNPGGLPLVGNAAFSISMDGSPQAAPGVLVLALAGTAAPLPWLGVNLWVDTTRPLVTIPLVPQGARSTLPLPIPNNLALRQARVWLQTLHFTGQPASPFDASGGCELCVL